jgi:hypothetical protein
MKIVALYDKHYMKYIFMLFGKNMEVFSVETGGKPLLI